MLYYDHRNHPPQRKPVNITDEPSAAGGAENQRAEENKKIKNGGFKNG